MIYLTSDNHFGHKNIIEYCGRPFESVEEMDAEMIRRWNVVVKPGDTVWHLGDFSFYPRERTREILDQLHGEKHLVLGNHDPSRARMLDCGFATVDKHAWVGGYLAKHDPCELTGPALCGHVHEAWRRKWYKVWSGPIVNVGVDQWSFAPVSLDEIRAIMAQPRQDTLG